MTVTFERLLSGSGILAIILLGGCASHINKAGSLIKRGEYDAAIAESTLAIEESDDEHRNLAYTNRAIAYGCARQYDRAQADYESAIKLNPADAITYANYTGLLMAMRRYDAAETLGRNYLARFPNSVLVSLALAAALDANGKHAAAYQLASRPSRSLESYSPRKYSLEGGSLVARRGEIPLDRELQYANRDSVIALAYGVQAEAAAGLGNRREALALMEKAEAFLCRFDVQYLRGTVQYALSDYPSALQAIQAAQGAATVEQLDSWSGLQMQLLSGNCHLHRGEFGQAEVSYKAFIAANKYDALAFKNLGEAQAGQSKIAEAIGNYTLALQLKPELGDALVARGALYLKAKKYESAIGDFSSALRVVPSSTDVLYRRAYAYCLVGQKDSSMQDINAILQREPNNAKATELAEVACP